MVAAEWLSFSDAVLLAAVCGAAIKILADYRGWTRSPALVRQENSDLRERNATLAAEVERLSGAQRESGERIAVLEAQLAELKKQDQAAVLAAIAAHEQSVASMSAAGRAATGELQTFMREHERQATLRHAQMSERHTEALAVWREIRDNLKGG